MGQGPAIDRSLASGRAKSLDLCALLLVVWAVIGVATASTDGDYSLASVSAVTLGAALLVAMVALGLPLGSRSPRFSNAAIGAAVGAAVFSALLLPSGLVAAGPALWASRVLNAAAALALATWSVFRLPRERLGAYLIVLLMAAAGVAMVLSSPNPLIDVWSELQAATHALSHGQNIYTSHWTSGVTGEASNGFEYLPGAALLLWPFHAVFGDVRYGLVAASVVTAVALIRVSPMPRMALAAPLFMLYPRATFGIEQSWVDPLTLCALSLMGLAMIRGRRGWAVFAFAVALSCKQYNWLLVPFAALWVDFGLRRTAIAIGAAVGLMLPWVMADPHAFISGAITYDLDHAPPPYSLSLYGHTLGLSLTAAAVIAVVALGLWRLPRDQFGFFVGSAAVIAVFVLFNRISFYDEWELAAGLSLLAFVFGPMAAMGQGRGRQEIKRAPGTPAAGVG